MFLQADLSEINKLGFSLEVPFEEGIQRVVDFYQSQIV